MATDEPVVAVATAKDARLDHMGGLVQVILRCSEEKWLKLLAVEDNRTQLTTHFLDDPNSECIFVAESSGGVLGLYTSSANLPFAAGKQQKAAFFLKVPGAVATAENMRLVISCGDLFSSTVEQLQAFLDYAVIPTLCNPSCHEGWAKERARDLLTSVRAFRSIVARGVAQSKNHVIISVPPIHPFEPSADARGNHPPSMEEAKEAWMQETVSILESSVRHWSEQIQEVLDEGLHSGKHYPQPSDYYKFFCHRRKSLLFIRQQLRSESLELISDILQSKNSPRDAELKDLIKKVEDAPRGRRLTQLPSPAVLSWDSGMAFKPRVALPEEKISHSTQEHPLATSRQTAGTLIRSDNLPTLTFKDVSKVFPTCVRCSAFQAPPKHILDCLGLSKQDIYQDPLMVLDF
ncbi:dynein heavy chain 11, axonemal [Trichonephila clavipes]|nr:dynein heavy chain 11, axonemal [Trichonephila clavipes]